MPPLRSTAGRGREVARVSPRAASMTQHVEHVGATSRGCRRMAQLDAATVTTSGTGVSDVRG